jgi:hypothetical protein
LPDREKVCIAATSSVKFFKKLYLYQCPTYGTGLSFTIDLIESDPKDQIHYAFCIGRKTFNEIYARLNRLAGLSSREKYRPTNGGASPIWPILSAMVSA